MTERTQSGLISRRTVFSLIGVALPATIFAVSQGSAQTPGMERREERRDDRQSVAKIGATTAKSGAKIAKMRGAA